MDILYLIIGIILLVSFIIYEIILLSKRRANKGLIWSIINVLIPIVLLLGTYIFIFIGIERLI